jgi:hypothetical protein
MERGRCELCHEIADLHDSHYLPKGGYKRMRASGLKNPNPVVLSGGKARQSSLQVRDYKFCGECEKRFNNGGEAWILNHIPQNYGEPFWLQALVSSTTPIRRGDDLLFPQAVIPEVDMAQLVYFALSIFWRGTRRWSAVEGGQPPELNLGRQEEAIRLFLLGRSKLPEDVVVTVAVWPYKKVHPMALIPRADSATSYRSYWFYFFGFIFQLALGDEIPAQQRQTCSYHSGEKFLTVSLGLGTEVKKAIRKEIQSLDHSRLKGMLKEIKAKRSE